MVNGIPVDDNEKNDKDETYKIGQYKYSRVIFTGENKRYLGGSNTHQKSEYRVDPVSVAEPLHNTKDYKHQGNKYDCDIRYSTHNISTLPQDMPKLIFDEQQYIR
jgi:hypothetical protein